MIRIFEVIWKNKIDSTITLLFLFKNDIISIVNHVFPVQNSIFHKLEYIEKMQAIHLLKQSKTKL